MCSTMTKKLIFYFNNINLIRARYKIQSLRKVEFEIKSCTKFLSVPEKASIKKMIIVSLEER